MPDLSAATFVTRDPGAYNATLVGTAAGTTTISSEPCFFAGVSIPTRVAGSAVVIYDSIGTSDTVIGTITLGTQPGYDAPPTYLFNVATKNGLTVANNANLGATVLWK